jgi:hypothetical protein
LHVHCTFTQSKERQMKDVKKILAEKTTVMLSTLVAPLSVCYALVAVSAVHKLLGNCWRCVKTINKMTRDLKGTNFGLQRSLMLK